MLRAVPVPSSPRSLIPALTSQYSSVRPYSLCSFQYSMAKRITVHDGTNTKEGTAIANKATRVVPSFPSHTLFTTVALSLARHSYPLSPRVGLSYRVPFPGCWYRRQKTKTTTTRPLAPSTAK